MNLREQLANEILETRSGDITKTLKPFAIGRWVSVEERLPEMGKPVTGKSKAWVDEFNPEGRRECFCYGEEGKEQWNSAVWENYHDTYISDDTAPEIWLEMPSGKGEA